ncbi:MAG: AMP-binding protein, partial [bacterium]|nr:AMP-binding protein [bacterium]
VEILKIERDLSRNPLFDTLFVLQNMAMERVELPGLKLEPRDHDTGISKFDLTFICEETEENLIFVVEYSTRLFARETAAGFIGYFKKIVSTILENPKRRILEIEILTGPEKTRLLYEFNNTREAYPEDKTTYESIDPLQPEERISYMLDDSRAALLLTTGGLSAVSSFRGPMISTENTVVYAGDSTDLTAITSPTDVVYTIYSSGTSGKSKGALIENRNLVNYVSWFSKTVRLTGEDRGLLTSSFAFDLGYTSIYSSLLTGC